jgi:hypothetical protein
MNPKETLDAIVAAIEDGDIETARERAENLRNWLSRGGFYPDSGRPGYRELTDNFIRWVITCPEGELLAHQGETAARARWAELTADAPAT